MLGEGLVQALNDHISQTNIEAVFYYFIGVARHIGRTQKTHEMNQNKLNTYILKMLGPITLKRWKSHNMSRQNKLLQYLCTPSLV